MPAIPRRFRLRDLLIFLLLLAMLSSIGMQVLAGRRWQSREMACASNLRSLWSCALNYAEQYGGGRDLMPSDTGAGFFMRLQSPQTPVVNRFEPFFCPIAGDRGGWGRTTYRGPASDVNAAADIDPIAADKEGNHGGGRGGNVLLKLGDIRTYELTEPLWIRARVTTKE